ncbi:PepSY-associated transmembrane protein [Blastomonas natatoria]|uniref:PepSY-associated transmembrane protein n=1 Tax=Blastomonas natatoria TaxID=34015 RepID=A0A2V3VAN1_9SPHN|nr:PepSY domain-containing protein [Blastomonas natatoria]PXW73789.1 PepSY-associated transmembrane protein [Blastomonas natatoria]
MANRPKLARWSMGKHQWLALIGGISLFIWGLSGMAHIVMVLFGPQQAEFMPPMRPVDMTGAVPVQQVLANAGVTSARAVKVVVGKQQNLLQVTVTPQAPRRYFRLDTGAELPGEDARQAEFIARHFLKEQRPVAEIVHQKAFDADYPWVNRLLPVWRIRFAGDDQLTAYVHTETSSLAAVNNLTKTRLQGVFRALHSWEWVPEGLDWLRVIVIALMVGSLAALAVTGIMLLVAIRRGKRLAGSKGWHRAMGYVLALPLLMFSVSGIIHLVQSALEQPTSKLRLSPPVRVAGARYPVERNWAEIARGLDVNALSLVEGPDGRALYRLGLVQPGGAMPKGEHDHSAHKGHAMPMGDTAIRNARFEGVQPTGPALYIDAATGKPWAEGDKALARDLGRRFSGAPDSAIKRMELVTRFGPDYDFRNKRLPVWRIDYGAPVNATLFVDTATGVLADRTENWQKPERYIFSFIHKWNFLFPIGKVGLNAVVGSFMLALLGFMGGIGLYWDWRRRRGRAQKPLAR